jgi:hypothetical protein
MARRSKPRRRGPRARSSDASSPNPRPSLERSFPRLSLADVCRKIHDDQLNVSALSSQVARSKQGQCGFILPKDDARPLDPEQGCKTSDASPRKNDSAQRRQGLSLSRRVGCRTGPVPSTSCDGRLAGGDTGVTPESTLRSRPWTWITRRDSHDRRRRRVHRDAGS